MAVNFKQLYQIMLHCYYVRLRFFALFCRSTFVRFLLKAPGAAVSSISAHFGPCAAKPSRRARSSLYDHLTRWPRVCLLPAP